MRICFVVALLTMCLIARTAARAAAERFPLTFHIEGNRILDEAGSETVFRGLDTIDPVLHAFASWSPFFSDSSYIPLDEEYVERMRQWGATIISLSIHPAVWRVHGRDACFNILDRYIDAASRRGLYVYLEFHGIGYPPTDEYEEGGDYYGGGNIYTTSPEEIREFWDAVSRRYAGNDVVALYDIFNEPVYPGFTRGADPTTVTTAAWIAWRDFAEGIVDVIRANDPDTPIMVGGLDWAYDISYAADYPVRRPGIVYSTHPYPDSDWYKSWDEAFGDVKALYPVFVSEFGFERSGEKAENEYSGPGRYRDALKAYLDEKRMSWTAWCFSATWDPCLLEGANYRPTESGRFVRLWLSEHSSVEPVADLKINGSDGPLEVEAGDIVSLTASFTPGREYLREAAVRIVAGGPGGTFSFSGGRWRRGIFSAYEGPLDDLAPLELFNGAPGLPGRYTVRFEVETDGGPGGPGRTWRDTVTVTVD